MPNVLRIIFPKGLDFSFNNFFSSSFNDDKNEFIKCFFVIVLKKKVFLVIFVFA